MVAMPKYTVTVGYEWKTFCWRDVEVSADSAEAAVDAVMRQARSDSEFWMPSDEGDGEAGPTEVVDVREKAADS